MLLAIIWGGIDSPWSSRHVIGCLVGGIVILGLLLVIQHFVRDPLLPPCFLETHAIVAIFFPEFF